MVEANSNRADASAAIATQALLCGLKSAVDEVFATMLSTLGSGTKLGDPCLTDSPPAGKSAHSVAELSSAITVEACIDIRGPLQGWIGLSCTAKAADDIARGLLLIGSNEVLVKEQVEDALGECANMVAGVLKTAMLDPRGSFTIGIPRISTRRGLRECPRGTLAYRLCAGTLNSELWLDRRPDGC